ncbi:MAG: HD domain-containing protein [Pseudomonadota bacterium]
MRQNQCTGTVQPAFLKKHLHFLLTSLDGVRQSQCYHPEGDALYHSLQVFQLAHQTSDDPELWAAALLHDIGKAVSNPDHADIGADELEGLLSPRIVWLIRHHLHLLVAPRSTRRWLRNTPQLRELELLRSWDINGRLPDATVMTPREAIDMLIKHSSLIQSRNDSAFYYKNKPLA